MGAEAAQGEGEGEERQDPRQPPSLLACDEEAEREKHVCV